MYIKREPINNLAESVLEVFEIEVPIESMEDVVYKLGGMIENKDYISEFAEGKIKKIDRNTNDTEFLIEISNHQSDERRRFSIAHEIGHLFLHMGYLIDDEIWENTEEEYLRKYAGRMEYEANEFAAALLMPRDRFDEEMKKAYEEDSDSRGYYRMDDVADFFKVSYEAAVNRGRWLGYLAW